MTAQHLGRYGSFDFEGQPIYHTDLDACLPANVLAPAPKHHHWRTLDYACDDLSGVMLLAGPETAPPPITYRLAESGWHAISIGVMPMEGHVGAPLGFQVRLSGEETASVLDLHPHDDPPDDALIDLFWRVADVSGRDIVIESMTHRVAPGDEPGSSRTAYARIAYIKLVPLSATEVEALQADRSSASDRRLFAHTDAHGIFFGHRSTAPAEVRRWLEPYRHSDVSRIYWEAGGGDKARFFRTKRGRLDTLDGVDDFGRVGDRMHAETWREFRAAGVDPLAEAVEHAHGMGIELHACYRVAGFHYPPPLDHDNETEEFYRTNTAWRGVDRAGNPTPRMAYTYPGVREFVVGLLAEMAGYGVDGVCLLYNRRPPLVEYEPPLVDGFIAEFGQDPRRLAPHDPRWLKYRAAALTAFMREVRQAMDARGSKPGRRERIEVSAIVMGSEQENLVNAMDIKAWVDEGLVDTLIPYTSEPNLDSNLHAWKDPAALTYFLDLVDGTPCRLAPNIMPRQLGPEEYRRRLATIYAAGVEHAFFWDSAGPSGRHNFGLANSVQRPGHRSEIEAWARAGGPEIPLPARPLRSLGDWDLSYATPG